MSQSFQTLSWAGWHGVTPAPKWCPYSEAVMLHYMRARTWYVEAQHAVYQRSWPADFHLVHLQRWCMAARPTVAHGRILAPSTKARTGVRWAAQSAAAVLAAKKRRRLPTSHAQQGEPGGRGCATCHSPSAPCGGNRNHQNSSTCGILRRTSGAASSTSSTTTCPNRGHNTTPLQATPTKCPACPQKMILQPPRHHQQAIKRSIPPHLRHPVGRTSKEDRGPVPNRGNVTLHHPRTPRETHVQPWGTPGRAMCKAKPALQGRAHHGQADA